MILHPVAFSPVLPSSLQCRPRWLPSRKLLLRAVCLQSMRQVACTPPSLSGLHSAPLQFSFCLIYSFILHFRGQDGHLHYFYHTEQGWQHEKEAFKGTKVHPGDNKHAHARWLAHTPAHMISRSRLCAQRVVCVLSSAFTRIRVRYTSATRLGTSADITS